MGHGSKRQEQCPAVGSAQAFFDWRRENYDKVGQHLSPVPEHLIPKRFRMTAGDKLPDHTGVQGFVPIVSGRLRALVEEVEPGVHQFVPVEVERPDGTPLGEPYFFSNANLLDAINPDPGGVYKLASPWSDNYFWEVESGAENLKKLAVRKDVVAGKAMWCDVRHGLGIDLFFSDALLGRMRAVGLTGWYATQAWTEI